MAICNACNNKSLIPDKFNELVLCRVCSLKLMAPTWKHKSYQTNEEVDEQIKKVLEKCEKNGFSESVQNQLSNYLETFKRDGLIVELYGGAEQTITIFEDRVLIDTSSNFDYKTINKLYKRVVSGKRGKMDSFDLDPAVTSKLVGSVLLNAIPAKGALQKTVKQVGMSVVDAAFATESQGQSHYTGNIDISDKIIMLEDCVSATVIKPIDEEEFGFFIINTNLETMSDNVFVFSSFKARFVLPYLNEFITRIDKFKKQSIQENDLQQQKQLIDVPSFSNYEELKKLKELYDMGILTDEEFSAKKKYLLDL
ncbi:TPA: SHOCT domain-containing protein [Streptococcus suis]